MINISKHVKCIGLYAVQSSFYWTISKKEKYKPMMVGDFYRKVVGVQQVSGV
jgi:hypothetical protein